MTFRIHPGLVESDNLVSFEAISRPGCFIAASDTSMKRPLRLGLWVCPGIAASTTGRTGSGAEMVQ